MQTIIRGKNSLLQIVTLLRQKGSGEVLLVVGRHTLADALFMELCKELPVPYQILHPHEGVLQTASIPVFDTIDTIVAIGGGKVIDFAKGILHRHPVPAYFIAAPTTAGSGSEATPIAVFYQDKEKVALDAPHLLPAVAILDTALLTHLPKTQRAISGADALAQCIESIWNVHSTEESEKHALTGLDLLWKHLADFVEGAGESTAENVLWAAHLAGRAITLTRTTGPHALSYFLTAHYGVPHGQAVALTLPLFFMYNEGHETNEQLKKIYGILNVNKATDASSAIRQWLHQLGLATRLSELQLAHISLDDWLRSVNQQRFTNNPAPFDADRLKALFQQYLM